jgi:hypothetical protein
LSSPGVAVKVGAGLAHSPPSAAYACNTTGQWARE